MTTRRTESLLEGLHPQGPLPREAHRAELEAELLAGYDKRYSRPTATHRLRWASLISAAVLLLGVLAAAKAPAEYAESLGQRIEVSSPQGGTLPQGAELARIVEEGLAPGLGRPGTRTEVNVEVLQLGSGVRVLRIDVWGDGRKDLIQTLRGRIPALANANLKVIPLEGKVRTSLAGLLGHRMLRLRASPEVVAAARTALREQIGRGETGTTVEVDVQEEHGKQRVIVRMRRVSP